VISRTLNGGVVVCRQCRSDDKGPKVAERVGKTRERGAKDETKRAIWGAAGMLTLQRSLM
jgi:hypothetical protein